MYIYRIFFSIIFTIFTSLSLVAELMFFDLIFKNKN
jgi:hypothetical protein